MSLNFYSKESVDSLLSAKIGDAPSDGNQYVRKNAAWSILSGGGGGATWGSITGSISDQTDLQTEFGNYLALAGGTLTGAVYSNSIFSTSYLTTYTTVAPSGLTAYDGTNTTIVQGAGVVFTDSTIQTTAATTFNGGTVSNPLTIDSATSPQLYVTDSTHTTTPTLVVTDGTNATTITQNGVGAPGITVGSTGIIFADSTTQTTAFTAGTFLPLSGGAMTGALQLGGDLNCDGYNLSSGNFSSPAGQVNCQNLTLTDGSVTFADGSVQTTAASSGSPDYNAISYLSFCVNLAFLFQPGSWNPSTPNQFPFNSGNLNSNSPYFLLNNIGVTQDGVNFYPFDSISGAGVTFQASTFTSFNSGYYILLAFKDSAGTWHMAPSCIVYSP